VREVLPQRDAASGNPIIAHKYKGGIGGNEVWLYEVVGGDHSWLSGYLNTGEVIWEFFERYVK
jgi:polyhydroxybutyrate depolymerase